MYRQQQGHDTEYILKKNMPSLSSRSSFRYKSVQISIKNIPGGILMAQKTIGIKPAVQNLICSRHGFDLWLLNQRKEWFNLKLTSSKPRYKSNWLVAWNGERLDKGKDSLKLAEHEPFLCEWVISVLRDKLKNAS